MLHLLEIRQKYILTFGGLNSIMWSYCINGKIFVRFMTVTPEASFIPWFESWMVEEMVEWRNGGYGGGRDAVVEKWVVG